MKISRDFLLATIVYTLFIPQTVFAADSPLLGSLKNPLRIGSLDELAKTTIPDELINIGAILFVVVVLIGGLQYMMALGNEESTSKAKSTLTYGLIGLIIIALAKAGMEFIKQQLPDLFR